MPKFAIYQYLFGKIKYQQLTLPLFDDEDNTIVDVEKSWFQKQEIFGKLFTEEAELKFKVPEKKEYGHCIIPCAPNPNVIIMRFANNREKTLERNFQKVKAEDCPSTLVIIDNRKDIQRIAIWSNDAFTHPNQVVRIMERVLRERLRKDMLTIDIVPKSYSSEFWDVATRTYGRVSWAKFNLMHPNLPDLTNGIKELMGLASDLNGDPSIEIKPLEGQLTINLPRKYEASPVIRHIVDVCAALHQPINVKTIDGENVDCFVQTPDYEPEVKEHQVYKEIDKAILEGLESNDSDTHAKAILALVEFMTTLKLFND